MAVVAEFKMIDRKKPGVAFWATVVLVVLLVGYPLSIGPAFWAWQNIFGRSEAGWRILWTIYASIGMACESESVNATVSWWVSLWTGF